MCVFRTRWGRVPILRVKMAERASLQVLAGAYSATCVSVPTTGLGLTARTPVIRHLRGVDQGSGGLEPLPRKYAVVKF